MPSIARKLIVATVIIVISIVTPFLRFRSMTTKLLLQFLTGDGLYLICMMLAVSIAYAFILFEHFSKLKRLNAAQGLPAPITSAEIGRHIYPMALLICLSNVILGLASYLGRDALLDGTSHDPSCPGSAFCTGTSIVLVLPEVFVPNGMLLYAFWGAFIFNCYQYLNRIVNNDFPPSTWLSGAVRLAAAVLASILAFVALFQDTYDWSALFSTKGLQQVPGVPLRAGYAVAFAFFSGFFPMTTIRVVFRLLADRVSQLTPFLGKYVHTPLTVLDGITTDVQDRLAEAGVDSLQMLSRSTVQELKDPMGKALPYSADVLADWIDQAKLALYFSDEAELAEIRGLGIRTYSDLQRYQASVRAAPINFQSIGLKIIPPPRLEILVTRGQFP